MGASVPFFFKWIGILNETKSISAYNFWKFKILSEQNAYGEMEPKCQMDTSIPLSKGWGGIFKLSRKEKK